MRPLLFKFPRCTGAPLQNRNGQPRDQLHSDLLYLLWSMLLSDLGRNLDWLDQLFWFYSLKKCVSFNHRTIEKMLLNLILICMVFEKFQGPNFLNAICPLKENYQIALEVGIFKVLWNQLTEEMAFANTKFISFLISPDIYIENQWCFFAKNGPLCWLSQ